MKNKVYYIIGAGGIGISAIAKYLFLRGATVVGSDLVENDQVRLLRAMGITVHTPHDVNAMPQHIDVGVISPAVNETNEELQELRRRGVTVFTYPQMLGELSRVHRTIAVTGMHGKSTTTAMLGRIFAHAHQEPLVIVGSKVPDFEQGNILLSPCEDAPFIVEACEYRGHMQEITPHTVVMTNVDLEHLDFYRDMQHIVETFQGFVNKIPAGGLLVHRFDEHLNALTLPDGVSRVTVAIDPRADVRLIPGNFVNGSRTVVVEEKGVTIGTFTLSVPGLHNVLNAGLALTVALRNGISFEVAGESLSTFKGIWRRFEKIGESNGAVIYSDYGHHPTEICATLAAAREMYPTRKVTLIFEPHQHDRTKKLFQDFVKVLPTADRTFVFPIYDVAGREEMREVSSEELVEACRAAHVSFVDDAAALKLSLQKTITDEDVVIVMGAGTIDSFARELI